MIKGITVKLHVKAINGTDAFGAPIYTDTIEFIDNVLVTPTEQTDVVNDLNLYGKKSVYTLGIPKGDTHIWDDTEVEFFDKKWATFGASTIGIEEMIPLSWNRKVKVAVYE